MKAVLQRVVSASVTVGDEIVGQIDRGYLLLLGIGKNDSRDDAERLSDKIAKLRIFPDEKGKTNLSIADVGGELLVVSQFTLYADCSKNRPSFSDAALPDSAKELYEYFTVYSRKKPEFAKVACGVFGAAMKVELVNDGPFTINLES
jgi:D-tyrosyl-tRNA(Tyr) deacylase